MRLEEIALTDDYFVERKLYPNVDFYTGLIYKAMGFPTKMFTVLFALGRLPGWIAHWREMMADPDDEDRPAAADLRRADRALVRPARPPLSLRRARGARQPQADDDGARGRAPSELRRPAAVGPVAVPAPAGRLHRRRPSRPSARATAHWATAQAVAVAVLAGRREPRPTSPRPCRAPPISRDAAPTTSAPGEPAGRRSPWPPSARRSEPAGE